MLYHFFFFYKNFEEYKRKIHPWFSHVSVSTHDLYVCKLGKGICIHMYVYTYMYIHKSVQFSSVQLLSLVQLFATPWTTACQTSLSITNSRSSPKPMSIESVMPSNHLILCHPLLLLPSIFPSISVFSDESALRIRWPKYWSFSFNISPTMNTQDWSPLG